MYLVWTLGHEIPIVLREFKKAPADIQATVAHNDDDKDASIGNIEGEDEEPSKVEHEHEPKESSKVAHEYAHSHEPGRSHCKYGTDLSKQLTNYLRGFLDSCGSVGIYFSRRTPDKVANFMRKELGDHPKIYVYDGEEPNPHIGHLAWIDAFIVTADSISMLSEACSTGSIISGNENRGKFSMTTTPQLISCHFPAQNAGTSTIILESIWCK
ncbi:putative mitochondrial fission protein ELM1 [Helianthus annuus]|uniref:Mitochondrial fission protein ELM1 n=1 Tax=Helianthus annuus TaxID=4232 RepID=A0A9K3J722_HELAN|nr:putative mitochondrial fission protein ELM1 [Helianthus annuus]KAJ0931082.1 putative mitochondrial fission protein ELM1 [Helianthus annuus]